MYVLDTNVLSELRKVNPEPSVADWVRGQPEELLFTTVMNIYEIKRGIESIPQPDQRQRHVFQTWLDKILDRFSGRILEWDAESAVRASLAHTSIEMKDCVIGAIADQHNMTVVTRNTKHLDRVAARTLNPWIATR